MSSAKPSAEERARKLSPCTCDPDEVALPCWEGEDDRGKWCWNCLHAEDEADEIRAAELAAEARGREAGLEAAAKVCDDAARKYDELANDCNRRADYEVGGDMGVLAQECRATRDEIRALSEGK